MASPYVWRSHCFARLTRNSKLIELIDYESYVPPFLKNLYRDLKLESPYNTYKIKGLPPGPISMPDISSIDAVLNSRSHDYIFFVADPYNPGYHLFASTLRQHNKNRRVYTRWLNSKKIYR